MRSLSSNNIVISEVQEQDLYSIAEFVVKENFNHHCGNYPCDKNLKEIVSLYKQDCQFYPFSKYYAAYGLNNEILGSIKVTKWNKTNPLPLQNEFGINLSQKIKNYENKSFWHIGRFAIKKNAGYGNIKLLKILMLYAISPICEDSNGIMLAECDRKLLSILKIFGITASKIGDSQKLLWSESFPICASSTSLKQFFEKNIQLYKSNIEVNKFSMPN